MQAKHLCVLILIWTKGQVGAPLNWFKPSSKIFYWPLQGGVSIVDQWGYFCLFCYAFIDVCLFMPCGHLLRQDWPLGSRLWCLIVTLSLSHWYPGSAWLYWFLIFALFLTLRKIVSEYDQEIPQSQTAHNPVAPRERAAQPSRDTKKTN